MKERWYKKTIDFSKKVLKFISNNRLLSLIIILLVLPYFVQAVSSIDEIIEKDILGYKVVYVIKITKPISYENMDIDSVYKKLKDFDGDGLILYVDSPGGSLETYKLVKVLRNFTKPSVCYIHYYGTSGAYWLCSLTDKIIAEDFAVVGSVGGIMTIYDISGLLEKLGVNVTILKTGEYKDVGLPFRKLTPEEKKWLEKQLQLFVKEFQNDVSSNRNLTNISDVFSAKWYFGVEAKEVGLVDEIGDYDMAKEEIAKMLNTTKDRVVFEVIDPSIKKSWLQKIVGTYYEFFGDVYSHILKSKIDV